MKSPLTSLLAVVSLGLLLGIQQSAFSASNITVNPEEPLTVPKTQEFESGEKEMSAVAADALERFLQDLNQRKDWDYACHNGRPGPDSAYLFKWVVRTTGELQRRGYYFDADGQLRRPGTVVPVR